MIHPSMKPYFKLAGVLGFCLLAIDVVLAFKFGVSIDTTTGIIYALIAVGSGVLLVIAAYFWMTGVKPLGALLAIVWVPVFMFNVWSQIGTHTSGRMGDVQQAALQGDVFSQVTKNKDEFEAKRKFFLDRRVTLKANMTDLTQLKVGAWSVNVVPATAADLDPLIEAKKLEVGNESKRGGCQQKCEGFTNQLSHLQRLRALAVEVADNEKQLSATEAGLANTREKLAHTDAGHSSATNQSSLYAKIMAMSLSSKPNSEQITIANEATGIFSAILLCLLSAALVFAEAWPRLMEVLDGRTLENKALSENVTYQAGSNLRDQRPIHVTVQNKAPIIQQFDPFRSALDRVRAAA